MIPKNLKIHPNYNLHDLWNSRKVMKLAFRVQSWIFHNKRKILEIHIAYDFFKTSRFQVQNQEFSISRNPPYLYLWAIDVVKCENC